MTYRIILSLLLFTLLLFITLSIHSHAQTEGREGAPRENIVSIVEYGENIMKGDTFSYHLKGAIELNAQLFNNDMRECPFRIVLTISGAKILDCHNIEYKYISCSIDNCTTIHLYRNN